jgi:hypothetical protein
MRSIGGGPNLSANGIATNIAIAGVSRAPGLDPRSYRSALPARSSRLFRERVSDSQSQRRRLRVRHV